MSGRCPLCIVEDIDGGEHDVYEIRDAPGGLSVYLGRPAGRRGRGGNRVVLTRELADYLTARRRDRLDTLGLPIGRTAVKELRARLGIDRNDDAAAWWEARLGDLRTLTLEAFAARHGCSASAAERERLARFGRINRPDGWWREGDAREALLSGRPASDVAEELGVRPGTVRGRKSELKTTRKPDRSDDA